MKKKSVYFLLLFSVMAFSVAFLLLPASRFLQQLQQQIPQLYVSDVKGFLGRGSLSDIELVRRGYAFPIGDAFWQFDFRSFIFLKPCIKFNINNHSSDRQIYHSQGYACLHLFSDQIIFHDVSVAISAKPLAELLGISIAGDFQGEFSGLTLENKKVHFIRGDVIWDHARFNNGEQWLELGRILLSISNTPSSIAVHFLDMPNEQGVSPVDIDIDIQFGHQQRSRVVGSLKPANMNDQSLLHTIELIADYREGNRFFVERILPN